MYKRKVIATGSQEVLIALEQAVYSGIWFNRDLNAQDNPL